MENHATSTQTEAIFSLLAVTDQNSQIHQKLQEQPWNPSSIRSNSSTNSHQIHTNSSNSSPNSIHRDKQKQNSHEFNRISYGSQRFRVNLHHRTRTPAIRTRARHWKQRATSVIAGFRSEKKRKRRWRGSQDSNQRRGKEAIPAYQRRFKAKDQRKRFESPITNTGNALTSPHFNKNHYRIQNDVNL